MLISSPRNGVSSPNVLSAISRSPELPLLENNSSLNDSLVTFIIQIHCCFINYIIQVCSIKTYRQSGHAMSSPRNGVSSPLVLAPLSDQKTSFLHPNGMNPTPLKGRPRYELKLKLF